MFRALLSVGFCMLLAGSAVAQLASQTALVGRVTDSSGSVVPGAVVVAVNVGTQDTYETTTNAQGQYNFQFVRTGDYEVTVTLPGFRTFKVSGIDVANNQVVRRDAPNFNNPNATFGTANFGRIASAQSMRQMQVGAKIRF